MFYECLLKRVKFHFFVNALGEAFDGCDGFAVGTFTYALTRGTGVTFYFGGTSVLICVGVALDTFRHIADHLRNTKYDELLDGKALGKIKGRARRSAA